VRPLDLGQPGGPQLSVAVGWFPSYLFAFFLLRLAHLASARSIPEPREPGRSGRLRSGAPKSIPIARSTATAMESHHASRGRRTVRLLLLFLLFRPFLRRDGAQIPRKYQLLRSEVPIMSRVCVFVAAGGDPAEESRREDATRPADRGVSRGPLRLVHPSLRRLLFDYSF